MCEKLITVSRKVAYPITVRTMLSLGAAACSSPSVPKDSSKAASSAHESLDGRANMLPIAAVSAMMDAPESLLLMGTADFSFRSTLRYSKSAADPNTREFWCAYLNSGISIVRAAC